jgi:dimethylaniline monooxygenase (N-oxide forming)
VSGLVTLKECLAKGFTPTVFESQKHSGGQWRYTEPDPVTGEVHSSVSHGTVFNSCRDTSAFSDFPYDPARYPEYLPHKKFVQYLDEYAEFFDLNRHVRYDTKVIRCEQTTDGGWSVTYEQNGTVLVELYDVLFACTGHLSKPITPRFEGLENFKGKLIHSHVYRRPGPFEGEKVAVIGIGPSAVDVACEISPQTEECHVITRSGAWIIPRFVLGAPVEAFDSRLTTYLPATFGQWTQKLLLNFIQGNLPSDLKPAHNILEAIPTIRSDFLEKVNVGFVQTHRSGIERFTENGLVLTNGTELDVDTVISCTGYLVSHYFS